MGNQNYPGQQNAQPGQPGHEKPGEQRPGQMPDRDREDQKQKQQQGGKQY